MKPAANRFSGTLGKIMIVTMWVVLLGLLTFYFQDFLDAEYNPNRDVQSRVSAQGSEEIVLQRNRYGHYVASGTINGTTVRFLLDTGATDVSVPGQVARRIGLQRGAARYAQTANGVISVFATTLDNVRLGSIGLDGVQASINPHMQSDDVLLGMSFLKQLEFTQRGDQLIIRQASQ